jgi:hypothetical protein
MLVKVIKTPIGPAPEVVRQQWVGVVLEPVFIGYYPELDFLKDEPLPPRRVCMVETESALAALEKHSPGAATWFRDHLFPDINLCFGEDEIAVIQNESI